MADTATARTSAKRQSVQPHEAPSIEGPAPVEMPDVYRDPVTGRLVAGGRTRKHGSEGNPYHVPPEIIPQRMVYQWMARTVFNQEQTGSVVRDARNGWTAVPTERHPGLFLPDGATGPIEIDGQLLMENRVELVQEARAEEKRNADRPVHQVSRAFGIKGGTQFDTDARGARANTFIETNIGPANIPLE